MKAQFKYAILHGLEMRLYALAATVLINLVFTAMALTGIAGEVVSIWGIVLSSLCIAVVFAVNIISDGTGFETIFGTPKGYLNIMTPVKSWKILLPRVIIYTIEDFIGLAIAVCGVVLQGLAYDNSFGDLYNVSFTSQDFRSMFFAFLMSFIGYAYLLMVVAFGLSLKSAFFSGRRFGALLAIVCTVAVVWVFNLFNFVLAPVGNISHWNNFYSITLNFNSAMHVLAYCAVSFIKLAALFTASSMLIERRINL